MPSLENKIRGIINKKKETLKEDANGVVTQSQPVQPQWVDLGAAPIDPHGALPDYTKGITPGQAALPGMNPTPGVGTVNGDAKPFVPQQEITEDEGNDEDRDDEDEKDGDEKPAVNEDNTADEENQRQYDKIKKGEPQNKLNDPNKNKKDDEDDDVDEGYCSKESLKEDVAALFAGEKLTAAFKKKATTIFEAAVNARVKAIVESEAARLVEEYSKEVENFKNDLTEKVDQYLDFVAGQWLTENALAIDTGIRNELVEDFLVGLKQLFTENYIDIPAEKVDVVEALAEKVEELEESLNQQIEANVVLKEENGSLQRHKLITESAKGLTEAQADKFVQLAEGVEFKDSDSFNESLKVLKESQIVVKPKKSQNLTEDVNQTPIEQPKVAKKTEMNTIIEALKKTSR